MVDWYILLNEESVIFLFFNNHCRAFLLPGRQTMYWIGWNRRTKKRWCHFLRFTKLMGKNSIELGKRMTQRFFLFFVKLYGKNNFSRCWNSWGFRRSSGLSFELLYGLSQVRPAEKKLKMKKRVIFKSNFQSRLCTTHNSSFNSLITSLTLTFKIYLQTNANF